MKILGGNFLGSFFFFFFFFSFWMLVFLVGEENESFLVRVGKYLPNRRGFFFL